MLTVLIVRKTYSDNFPCKFWCTLHFLISQNSSIMLLYVNILVQTLSYKIIYIYIYRIHHWRILSSIESSYRKLAWVGFESMTTEFRSDALTNWAIRPWSSTCTQSQLCTATPHFHLFVHCSCFISINLPLSHRPM